MACRFSVNDRTYTPPVVIICMEGYDDEYLTAALAAGRMPNVADMIAGAIAVWTAAHLRLSPT